MAEPDDNPLRPTKGDHALTVAKVIVAAVPYMGGPAAEILAALIRAPLTKRLEAWCDQINLALAELRETRAGLDPDSLAGNQDFVSAVQHATQIAVRTHRQENLDALRNAVLNVAAGTAPHDDLQLMFLAFVDAFTPLHLRMLKFFRNPTGSLASAGKPLHPTVYNTMAEVLPIGGVPHGFSEQVFLDLVNRSLVGARDLQESEQRAWAHVFVSPSKATEKRVTPLGDAFLAFIESPRPEAP
jgi:hypothetical protein